LGKDSDAFGGNALQNSSPNRSTMKNIRVAGFLNQNFSMRAYLMKTALCAPPLAAEQVAHRDKSLS
jgi:hypothetical protein